jgi:hypothetical protein
VYIRAAHWHCETSELLDTRITIHTALELCNLNPLGPWMKQEEEQERWQSMQQAIQQQEVQQLQQQLRQ